MKSQEIKRRYINFFKNRKHENIASASLVPENDPSALFVSAGVQPIIPFIIQGLHPKGDRLVSVQKCVRTTDIDDVGDNTHCTFFEMLGNWSIGNYFKEEAIKWSYELLTSKDEGFGLDPRRLYITVFEGDENSPKDLESVEIWKNSGIPKKRIYFRGKDNWWSPGENGPCGPSTEMFYDLTEKGLGDMTPEEFEKADEEQKVVEIWNDVFMEYKKENGKIVGKLPKKNVDTGAGLERLTAVLQKKDSVYDTDIFDNLKIITGQLTETKVAEKILMDHIRTSVFIISDGVIPSNTDRGYILRRLLRRAMFQTKNKYFSEENVSLLVDSISDIYKEDYPEIEINKKNIEEQIMSEVNKFKKTLDDGLKKINSLIEKSGNIENFNITEKIIFDLYQTDGFPVELTLEVVNNLKEKEGLPEIPSDIYRAFLRLFKEHQEKSRTAASGKFKGGLGGHSQEELKLHTATHLLNAALRNVLGEHIMQKGSNINPERLRFDFIHTKKLTSDEIKKIEEVVNQKIKESLPVSSEKISFKEAKKKGAVGVFEDKYDDMVSVYSIGKENNLFSLEICGGPHVKNTSELGKFKIKKEESVSAGVRRIKAVLIN